MAKTEGLQIGERARLFIARDTKLLVELVSYEDVRSTGV